MKFIKSIYVFIFCSCFGLNVLAQPADAITYPDRNAKVADKIYDNLGYKASLTHFEALPDLNSDDLVKIANSYRLNHDTENAELWYSQVLQVSDKPLYKLYYAQALHSNRKYDLAKKYYLDYDKAMGTAEGTDKRGMLSAQAVSRINEFVHTDVQVKNERIINSDKLDFSPTYYQDGIVFVSTQRAFSNKSKGKDYWIDDNFMSLFFAKKNEVDNQLTNVEEFSHDLNTKYHEGPVTFSRDGNKIFFTRNNYNKGKRRNDSKGIMKLKIFSSVKTDGEWNTAEEMPWSTDDYEECHPTLSADGQTLYFSSDREGGEGGMDIYKSEFKGGKWTTPQNLGKSVNTPGNEVFPFVHEDGTIYFASNGWGGLGGLDIFESKEISQSKWTEAKNIGTPFNSSKDDFGYILNVTGTEGYFTSARKNGEGKDDIYSFLIPANVKANKSMAKVCAHEIFKSEMLLPGVKVKVLEKELTGNSEDNEFVLSVSPTEIKNEYGVRLKMKGNKMTNNQQYRSYTTNTEGIFWMNVRPNKSYHMVAEKDGFVVAEESFETGEILDQRKLEICFPIPLEKLEEKPKTNANCLVLEGKVLNEKYGNTIGAAKVTMINLCSGDEVTVVSDEKGKFNFPCIPCGCEFVLKGEKKNFKFGTDAVSSLNSPCDKPGVVLATIPLSPIIPGLSDEPTATSNKSSTFPNTFPSPSPYRIGSVIELENIYYDFNKYYIRDDAKGDLDNIVSLMKRFPEMEIELGSHTDARGRSSYNLKLSHKRAKAARYYIINQGIDSRRITAKGYGETMLRNECKNYKECSEEDHQFNRRTEVKITKLNDKDIEVHYKDNGPEKIDRANPKRKYIWD